MLNDWVYRLCIPMQRLMLRLFADWQVNGIENVPPMGALIIIANHQSNFDPPLLSASIPRRVYFLAKSSLFMGHAITWFLNSYGASPVNRDGGDIRAYRWVISQLRAGKPVVLFPEGTRSRTGMMRAKSGIAQIAIQSAGVHPAYWHRGDASAGNLDESLQPDGQDYGKHRAGILCACD